MNDEELLGLLEELEAMLVDLGLDAISTQEQMTAAEGRPVRVSAEEVSRASADEGQQVKPRIGDVRRVPLTTAERLANLLDLIEAAVGGTFLLERQVLVIARDWLPERSSQPDVLFLPTSEEGMPVGDDRIWSLTVEDGERPLAVNEVMEALLELRRELDLPRGEWLASTRQDPNASGDPRSAWL